MCMCMCLRMCMYICECMEGLKKKRLRLKEGMSGWMDCLQVGFLGIEM